MHKRISDYRQVYDGQGAVAGYIRMRLAFGDDDGRWELRRVGESDFAGAYPTEAEAEGAVFETAYDLLGMDGHDASVYEAEHKADMMAHLAPREEGL